MKALDIFNREAFADWRRILTEIMETIDSTLKVAGDEAGLFHLTKKTCYDYREMLTKYMLPKEIEPKEIEKLKAQCDYTAKLVFKISKLIELPSNYSNAFDLLIVY